VILGNPPYSVSSVNKSDFIEQEMELYKKDVREEKNIQPLSDDYIKFIRFAHWKIDHDGKGIIGMITNNSYLSGLIHRGMRKRLLDSFDEIYILNLHGNSRIGEKCPDGSKDENVFDIQQGVSIVLFIKREQKGKACKVFYQDVYGLRERKYTYLGIYDIHKTAWKKLHPSDPYYFFVEKDFSLQTSYDRFFSVINVFDKYSSGVKTNRDHFLTDFDLQALERRIQAMRDNKLDDELFSNTYHLKDGNYWNTAREREKVRNNENWQKQFHKFGYRPFDTRWIFYQPNLIEIGRGGASKEIMRNFFEEGNIGLMVSRQVIEKFRHSFVSCNIVNYNFIDVGGKFGTGNYFPLYLYPSTSKRTLLSHLDREYRSANINSKVSRSLSDAYKRESTPEEIFYYIYAVLYSETYRTKYAEFLKIEFPRVPFTKDYKLFKKMSDYGKMLADLHLLKSTELDSPITRFQGKGDNRVKKLKYDDKDGILYINKEQYFEGISQDVWSYQIGGYQVCDKWLKDRKERILSLNEIQTYCKIVTSIQKTIEIQKAIDEVYNDVEREIIGLKVMKNKDC
jgi:predicted helicase